ncbi:MAG: hypothetical protein COB30_004965 [Ectothiorhodospiraceae bacterium]|nr:hypothetical protein [Ectothiorhodospiraceae bacterium]
MQFINNLNVKYKILMIALVGIVGFTLYLVMNYQVTQDNSQRLSAVRTQHFPVLELSDRNIVYLDKIK